jgi:enoyl-CoA hydratase/carnithine racemase
MTMAREIAAKNPQAIRGSKALYGIAADADAAAILRAESDAQGQVMRKPNQIEQVRANLEKRVAVFVD